MFIPEGGNSLGAPAGSSGRHSDIIVVDPSPSSPNFNFVTVGLQYWMLTMYR